MKLKERIINGWEISADGYSEKVVQDDFSPKGRETWTSLILSKAPTNEKMEILDVGTGPGVFATILSLCGHNVTGIDISPKMLEHAKENSEKFGISPQYLLMDSENIDLPDNSFDMIVSRNVVWIMENPENVYSTWLRILKPGGRVIVFDGGHGKDDFLTEFDHNNEEYIENYKKKFGKEPPISFARGKYEEARGWKRELKLTHEQRPQWDVTTMEKLGYINVEWENVSNQSAYNAELRFQNEDRLFFRLCGDKSKI